MLKTLRAVHKDAHAMSALLRKVDPKLTLAQAAMLGFLADVEGMVPMDTLAKEFNTTPGAMTNLVDKLVHHKPPLASRIRAERDRRLVLVDITEDGSFLLDRLTRAAFKAGMEL